mmetsp:Transcript_31343/g.76462  ORF Transcript_31343/g.76462 Transcript_31343/m.76462 type:complete len:211 (+) Transcript_31343:1415-2047(+)
MPSATSSSKHGTAVPSRYLLISTLPGKENRTVLSFLDVRCFLLLVSGLLESREMKRIEGKLLKRVAVAFGSRNLFNPFSSESQPRESKWSIENTRPPTPLLNSPCRRLATFSFFPSISASFVNRIRSISASLCRELVGPAPPTFSGALLLVRSANARSSRVMASSAFPFDLIMLSNHLLTRGRHVGDEDSDSDSAWLSTNSRRVGTWYRK